eukprot:gene1271-32619_t
MGMPVSIGVAINAGISIRPFVRSVDWILIRAGAAWPGKARQGPKGGELAGAGRLGGLDQAAGTSSQQAPGPLTWQAPSRLSTWADQGPDQGSAPHLEELRLNPKLDEENVRKMGKAIANAAKRGGHH